jgi:hypothetical protein
MGAPARELLRDGQGELVAAIDVLDAREVLDGGRRVAKVVKGAVA